MKFLQTLHNNIARTLATEKGKETSNNIDDGTKKKKKKQESIQEIFKIPDQKLHKHAYAVEAIGNNILRKRQNNVSVQDLAWYISNTKP